MFLDHSPHHQKMFGTEIKILDQFIFGGICQIGKSAYQALAIEEPTFYG